MESFPDVPHDQAFLRRPVVPLAMLLGGTAPNRWPEPFSHFAAESIDHVRHVACIDPRLLGNLLRTICIPDGPAFPDKVPKLTKSSQQSLLDSQVVAGYLDPSVVDHMTRS